ncbi:MAG: type III secretion system low calcium response chaperone LcrH/SycD [Chlamydiales bacterium]|jgi:type III secretion system low calcium response chaperone LcrH/SycD
MGKSTKILSLRDIMPDLLIDMGDVKSADMGTGLKDLLRDVEAHLSQDGNSPSDVQKFVSAIFRHVSKDTGIPAKQALGISSKDIEVLYVIAKTLYDNAKYDEAQKMFRLLIMIDHFDFKFLFGLAACLQEQEKYFIAATTYQMASTLDLKYPWSHFHAAECYMRMGDPVSACVSLGMAVEIAGNHEEYAGLKERCALAKVRLIDKINRNEIAED